MRVLLDPRRDVAIHHDLPQLEAPRADVVHQHLVRSQFELGGSVGALDLLQFDAAAELPDDLNPEPALRGGEREGNQTHCGRNEAKRLGG